MSNPPVTIVVARASNGVIGRDGGLPWRLLAFLEDAHRRGVLRRSGAYYRFRHAELQEYLAGRR